MTLPTQVIYLRHIHDALLAVSEYTKDGHVSFLQSKMIQDAVLRNLEIVGEAVKGLDADTRNRAPNIPWRRIAGMRDVLIHSYFGVDLEIVWRVVEVEVPLLLEIAFRLISELEAGT
jgi:uncharacterized protein with HEPN domain